MTNITARSIATAATVMAVAMVNDMRVHTEPHLHCPVPLWRPYHSASSSSSLLHLQSGSCCSLAPSLIVEGTE